MTDSPTYDQYLAIKQQYPEAIVLFRIGDFLEAFNQDAEEVARLLDLQIVSKLVGKAYRVPMAGFPYAAAEEQIGKLIAAGRKVGVAEQIQQPAPAGTKKVVTQDRLFEEAP